MRHFVVGARGSLLSVRQTEGAMRLLRRRSPGTALSFTAITTLGDRLKQWKRSDTGIFVKELEQALREKRIDLAVHSVKDLPSALPRSLRLAAVLAREDPRDFLITRSACPGGLRSLACNALVGTTSLRRRAMLLALRPDVRVAELRGNLDTRLRKLDEGSYDAIIVAAAGMRRLGLARRYAYPIPVELMLPACGQGALGIEIRIADRRTAALVKKVDDPMTHRAVISERSFLYHTQAGCRMPVAAYARIVGKDIVLEGMIISLDGRSMVRMRIRGGHGQAFELGRKLARRMLREGGRQILKEIRRGQE